MTSLPPSSRTTKPANVFPSFVSTIVTSYWSEIAFDGQRIDSTMSFFWKRLLSVGEIGTDVGADRAEAVAGRTGLLVGLPCRLRRTAAAAAA